MGHAAERMDRRREKLQTPARVSSVLRTERAEQRYDRAMLEDRVRGEKVRDLAKHATPELPGADGQPSAAQLARRAGRPVPAT